MLKASSPPPMVLSPKPRMQCIFHMWRLYTGRPVSLCHVCCAALGVDIGSFRLCCTYVGLKLLINFFCVQIVSWTSRHAAFYKKASRGKFSLQERPLGKITVEDLHKPSVRYLYARSLYNKVSTRDLRARSLQEISKISVQAL